MNSLIYIGRYIYVNSSNTNMLRNIPPIANILNKDLPLG